MNPDISDESSNKSTQGRTRCAVVAVDVVESVRLMLAHEAQQIGRWRRFVEEVQTGVLPGHGGRLVKSLGDGLLMEFATVRNAVAAAIEIQKRVQPYNARIADDAAMYLRIGVNVAEVVRDELDIYGNGVNLAARIAALAGPGEIVASADARDELVPGLDAETEDLGECFLKHYTAPVRVYRVGASGSHPVLSGADPKIALQPTVAVIPFDADAAGPGGGVLGELLADGVIAQLSRTPELRVISRLSSRAFAGRPALPGLVAAHLQANYLVSGVVHAHGERLLVMVELCETQGGSLVWAERLTGSVSELVEPHGELIDAISHGVHQAILQREVQRALRGSLPTLASYSLLLGAVNLMHRQSRDDFNRARALLEHLGERHPRHAEPKAWLAKWYAVNAAQRWTSDAAAEARAARHHVEMALAVEPANSLAWAIKGLLQGYVDTDFDGAAQAHAQALRHNPNESLAWLFLATLEGWRGHGQQAAEAAERALELSPLDPLKYYFDSLAGAAMLGGRNYAKAIELSQRSIRANRAHLSTFRVLTMAQVLAGDVEAARATALHLLSQDPGFTVASFMRASPWRASPDAQLLGQALHEAGIPRG